MRILQINEPMLMNSEKMQLSGCKVPVSLDYKTLKLSTDFLITEYQLIKQLIPNIRQQWIDMLFENANRETVTFLICNDTFCGRKSE